MLNMQGALAPGNLPGSAPRALVDAPPHSDAMMSNHSSLGSRVNLTGVEAVPLPAPAVGSDGPAGPSVGWAASSA